MSPRRRSAADAPADDTRQADSTRHLTAVGSRGRPDSPAPQRVSLTRVSWSPAADLELAEWIDQGHRIGRIGRSVGWWIGDWLRYGNTRYGEKYARAMKITGYDAQTLMNMVWVASRIDISRRRENLSWSHHAEVAGLDLLTQERLLNHAAAERLSVRDIRELLRVERRAQRASDLPDETDDRSAIGAPSPEQTPGHAPAICPQCGFSLASLQH